jgi:hypothetical protein
MLSMVAQHLWTLNRAGHVVTRLRIDQRLTIAVRLDSPGRRRPEPSSFEREADGLPLREPGQAVEERPAPVVSSERAAVRAQLRQSLILHDRQGCEEGHRAIALKHDAGNHQVAACASSRRASSQRGES